MIELALACDQSTLKDVDAHLRLVQALFSPPLGERVDITAYSRKLFERATRFEAWDNGKLVGLVAAYVDASARSFFVTSVSVLPEYARRGIASTLMQVCLDRFGTDGSVLGTLEVHSDNQAALSLYERIGFRRTSLRERTICMTVEEQTLRRSQQ